MNPKKLKVRITTKRYYFAIQSEKQITNRDGLSDRKMGER